MQHEHKYVYRSTVRFFWGGAGGGAGGVICTEVAIADWGDEIKSHFSWHVACIIGSSGMRESAGFFYRQALQVIKCLHYS